MISKAVLAATAAISLSNVALAQQSDAFDACALEKDAAARVTCFDRAVAARRAQQPTRAPATPGAPSPVTPVAPQVAAVAPAAVVAPAAAVAPPAHAAAARPAAGPTMATVVSVIPITPMLAAFKLGNGEIWEQTESMNFAVAPNEAVSIRSGVLGAFFMKNTQGVSVRVRRLQ